MPSCHQSTHLENALQQTSLLSLLDRNNQPPTIEPLCSQTLAHKHSERKAVKYTKTWMFVLKRQFQASERRNFMSVINSPGACVADTSLFSLFGV
jgi:hypothetical protein